MTEQTTSKQDAMGYAMGLPTPSLTPERMRDLRALAHAMVWDDAIEQRIKVLADEAHAYVSVQIMEMMMEIEDCRLNGEISDS